MPSNTVFTGAVTAFYALLRYIELVFASFRRNKDDIESGIAAAEDVGVAVSDSQDTSSSSFHCRGVDDSIVWSGPYVPSQPQATSTPKRPSRGGASPSSPKEESQNIGCLFIPSIEPQACRPLVSDGPLIIYAVNVPSHRNTTLHVANPDDMDYVFVKSPSEGTDTMRSSQPPSCPSLLHRPTMDKIAATCSSTDQPATRPPKSTSFSARRGYNKFIPLNGIVTTTDTHWTKKPSKAQAAMPSSSDGTGTPFSQMGINTPLPRYTPTNVVYGSSPSAAQPLSRAPSYTKHKTSPPRSVKRKVTIAYIAPKKATMSTCEPLTPPLESSLAAAPKLNSTPPRSPPVNSLVAEVLSRIRRGSPETIPSPNANLRPLILPQDLENRSPVLSIPEKSASRRPRSLVLPQQVATRAALRLTSVIEEPHFDDLDGLSTRSVSVYSQMSWQIIGSSTSLACTVGSDNDLQTVAEIGLHPVLKDWVPTNKRRAMCMPGLPMSQL